MSYFAKLISSALIKSNDNNEVHIQVLSNDKLHLDLSIVISPLYTMKYEKYTQNLIAFGWNAMEFSIQN